MSADDSGEHAAADAPAIDEAPRAIGPAPAEVTELAAACVGFVSRAIGFALDFTPETLPVLDHYVKGVRAETATKPEIVALVAPAIGAYLGEVIRRHAPLRWFCPPGEHQRWRLEFEQVFLSMNPIGAAMEAILVADLDGWGATFRMRPDDQALAKNALAVFPEVSPEEFYLPTTRFEALEVIVDALTARELAAAGPDADGGALTRYDADDYGPIRAEAIGAMLDGEDDGALN